MPYTQPVLIAEDDEDTVFFLKRWLNELGVRNPIKVVADGQQALDYLETESEAKTPRLVVLDVKMPLLNGFEVLKRVRDNPKLKRMPVIIFSSSNLERDVAMAYDLGANSYVVKPGEPERMKELVSKIHEYWIDINRSPAPAP